MREREKQHPNTVSDMLSCLFDDPLWCVWYCLRICIKISHTPRYPTHNCSLSGGFKYAMLNSRLASFQLEFRSSNYENHLPQYKKSFSTASVPCVAKIKKRTLQRGSLPLASG